MGIKRAFIIVLDSFGAGEAPDAALFGDVGTNTLRSISRSRFFSAANMIGAGLGNIDGLSFIGTSGSPLGAYARMREASMGKDTTIGHWEIAGVISPEPLPTYPNGFSDDIIEAFKKATGRDIICNRPYSGTEVIMDYGSEHVKTGKLIVYTSADSVFQIAAHEDIVPVATLYDYCRAARSILTGENAVGRVIARPFTGSEGSYKRTSNRADFSLEPPGETLLDALSTAGKDVIAVGKIRDIFAGRGITRTVAAHGNTEGMAASLECLHSDFNGLCFINLVDFDMLYGHRNDIDGYAKAVAEFDAWLPRFTSGMKDDDILIITADHGCDPGDVSTDHTREYTPMLMIGSRIRPYDLGTRKSFADIAATVAEALGVAFNTPGRSFYDEVKNGV